MICLYAKEQARIHISSKAYAPLKSFKSSFVLIIIVIVAVLAENLKETEKLYTAKR